MLLGTQRIIPFPQRGSSVRNIKSVLPEIVWSELPEKAHDTLPYFTQGSDLFGFYIRFKRGEDAHDFCKEVEEMQKNEQKMSMCHAIWTWVEEIAPYSYRVISVQGCSTVMMLWNKHRNFSRGGIRIENDNVWYPCKVSAKPVDNSELYGVKTG